MSSQPNNKYTNPAGNAAKYAPIIVMLLSSAACGPGIASDGGGDETGAGDIEPVWAEVVCTEANAGIPVWYGRPIGSADAWVIVTSETRVADNLAVDFWVEIDAWPVGDCAEGMVPDGFFPESQCVVVVDHGASVCLSGGDGWMTQVDHACRATIGPEPAWPDGICGGAAIASGSSPWDSIACAFDGLCAGVSGETVATVFPTCVVDSLPPCVDDAPGDQCSDYPGSLGCECVAGAPGAPNECLDDLKCIDDLCAVCPVGELGCSCGDGCSDGLGCTPGDTCVDCEFITGVTGCACNISDECESTSICVDGMCGPY